MKQLLIILSLTMAINSWGSEINIDDIFLGGGFGSQPNPELFPVEEDPGFDAEEIERVIHEKDITVDGSTLDLKWTTLGYGAITQKIIVPELADHTLFDHRNPGEEGPCLRSYSTLGSPNPVLPDTLEINIQIKNKYRINRERKICKVTMVEDVITIVDGINFVHTYEKDMGWRYIGDCR